MADPTAPHGIRRELLGKYFGADPRLVRDFERQSLILAQHEEALNGDTGTVNATTNLQNASIVTLSANEALNNEFILGDGDGSKVTFTVGNVKIDADATVVRCTSYRVTLHPPGNVDLTLPSQGTLINDTDPQTLNNKTLFKPYLDQPNLLNLVNASTESNAGAAGVPVGGMYRDGTTLKIRTA